VSSFAAALVDARLSAGEADRLERMVMFGVGKTLALRVILMEREQASA
jgi:hypothetical protein